MSEFPALTKPPVVEAIFDVQGIFPEGDFLPRIAALHAAIADEYPHRRVERFSQFEWRQEAGQSPEATAPLTGNRGYHFVSGDKRRIVQYRIDGFTFNQLAPYGGWEETAAKAKAAWELYRKEFPEFRISRVALRYLNRIMIPAVSGEADFAEFFKTGMPGPELPRLKRAEFFSQGSFCDPETDFEATWILARQPSADPSQLHLVLDLDVFSTGPILQEKPASAFWDSMRNLKNCLFYNSFTVKGLDLFR